MKTAKAGLTTALALTAVNFLYLGAPRAAQVGVKMEKKYVKPSDEELRKKTTPEQFNVIRQQGTEAPFRNAYWDNHAEGIYVDAATGEPLFSSKDKFDSGTGWPSFSRPLVTANVEEHRDSSHGMTRVEVRSKVGQSHLGHLFPDGPQPTGQRYCMNSASLKFIPVDQLEHEGYGQYKDLFAPKK